MIGQMYGFAPLTRKALRVKTPPDTLYRRGSSLHEHQVCHWVSPSQRVSRHHFEGSSAVPSKSSRKVGPGSERTTASASVATSVSHAHRLPVCTGGRSRTGRGSGAARVTNVAGMRGARDSCFSLGPHRRESPAKMSLGCERSEVLGHQWKHLDLTALIGARGSSPKAQVLRESVLSGPGILRAVPPTSDPPCARR
jgi:hypothetical protein